MANWIWMPFGVMSGVDRGMGVLDGMEIVKGKGQFGGNQWVLSGVVVRNCVH